MNDIKENRVDTLYKELCFYNEDLYDLSRILVKILPNEMIRRIINKLYRIRKSNYSIKKKE